MSITAIQQALNRNKKQKFFFKNIFEFNKKISSNLDNLNLSFLNKAKKLNKMNKKFI